ncbi:drug resistance transporter, EmrB/QacA subfamily [Actinopolymorpha cephalotaxi]|uniref:Drug resistance transporter, EmrB/QacA subfamily n=1 Tax=Actinopolymorpha cephalotaxi TaxID=504797 RepID=A0A1I3ASH4_9ACTN|nr:MFS transporter [Actinopolymorpha cephalotaxi]NYH86048.1 EmrB/QacA subfamily drug resistance transporter [Actinopolymorpha cephalotaxi]SFH53058.1 drug resistance transporter, EmrB/QacA subfamily [Actinopolymorpha cephalotaxi]
MSNAVQSTANRTADAEPKKQAAGQSQGQTQSQGQAHGQLSHGQILTIISGLMLGMFLAALDQTIVSTAIRTIADDLKGLNMLAWATTAYLITSTVSTPLYGKLSDLWGRRPLFLAAITIFVIGSLACTFSQSMVQLAGFRAFQGLGAGGLMSLAFAIVGDIVPPRERSRYQGYFMAVFASSSVLGPVIGGFFAGQSELISLAGWRWVFLVNVPIGVIALIVVARVLHVPHVRRDHRIDWLGAITIALCVVPLLIVAQEGRDWGWGSRDALLCYVLGGIGLITFILAEKRMGDDALIPLRLFKSPVFSLISSGGFFIGMAMFGAIAIVPQYLQIVKGASPTHSGLLMLPLMAGIMTGSLSSGQITAKTGRYKIFPLIGTVLMTVGLVLFHQVAWDTPLWQTDIYMAVVGLGLGLCMQTLTLAIQNAVPPRDMGVATSSSIFFRQMGGTLGTAVFLSLLFSTVGDKIANAFRTVSQTPAFQAAVHDPKVLADKANQPVLAMLHGSGGGGGAGASGVLQDSSFIQRLDPRLAVPFRMGFSDSMDLVFLSAAFAPIVAFVLLAFMKEIPLRTQSGMAARAAEEAGTAADDESVTAVQAETPEAVSTTAVRAEPEFGHEPATSNGHVNGHANGNGHVNGNGYGYAASNGHAEAGSNGHSGANGRHALADGEDFGQLLRVRRPRAEGAPTTNGSSVTPHDDDLDSDDGHDGHDDHDGHRIGGKVLRPDGSPISGAALTLINLDGHQVARALTDRSGGYAVPVLSAGTYVLIASAGAYQPQASTITTDGGPVAIDLVLSGSTRLYGTVSVGGSGAPVPDATVTLTDQSGEVVTSRVTGADGSYELEGLGGGHFTLVVSAANYRPIATGVTVPQGGEERLDLQVEGGGRLTGVARSGRHGHPIREALITFVDSSGAVLTTTVTDADGSYTLEDLPAGDYTVIASGYPPVASSVRVDPAAEGRHDVELGYPNV